MYRPSRRDGRVWLVSGVLALAGAFLWWRGPALPELTTQISWPLLALLFGLTERFVVQVPFGRENHALSFIEAPLVLGLLFSSSNELIGAGLVGTGVALAVALRTAAIKLSFNLALWLFQSSLAVVVFTPLCNLFGVTGDPLAPGVWLAILLTCELTHLCSGLAVFSVISLREGHAETAGLVRGLAMGAAGTLVVTDLALIAAVVIRWDQRALVLLAVLAALTFALYRGYYEQRLRYGRLGLLYEFTRSVDQSLEGDTVLSTVQREARTLLRARHAEVVLCPSDPSTLDTWWAQACFGHVLRVPRGRHGEPAEELRGTGRTDALAAPLRDDGRVVGVLIVADRLDDVSTFDAEDAKLFQALAGHASVALANSGLVERVRAAARETEHAALHDPLTGLPNRLRFQQRLVQRLTETGSAGVLLMDIDRFKEVNDTLGHDVGDRLLQQVALRLRRLERADTVVARLGGDEFAVLLSDDAVHIEGMLARITHDFGQPFRLGEIDLDVSMSIGTAIAPQDGTSGALLLRRAEVAMYDAKRSMSGVAPYSADRDPYSARRLSLTSDLARALEDHTLELHYQPQAEPGSGRVTGVEALIRWHHPVWGQVPPDEFIPLAEHTGLIKPLTQFVLETAVRQCAAWRAAGTPVVMSVNISMRNLLEPELADVVARLLVQADLPVGMLQLEVTESAIVSDPTRAVRALERLVALGLSVSIDDFGTGYSSLARLRNLPAHEIKIDRGFVQHLADSNDDLAIVRAVISLGHDLGLRVIAEGVEDERSWAILAELNCDLVQGYLLARAMPAAELTPWLAEHFSWFATRLPDTARAETPIASARPHRARVDTGGVTTSKIPDVDPGWPSRKTR